ELTASWDDGRDLFDAFAAAERARESAAYREFYADTFANPGAAGAACAAEILRLAEHGEVANFAVSQVRETTARYIQRNRQLKSHPGAAGTGGTGGHLRGSRRPLVRIASAVVRRASTRTRLVRRRLGLVRRPGKREFVANTRLALDAPQAPAPSALQRESIFARIRPFLQARKVRVVRDGTAPGAVVAVSKADRRDLFRALRACAETQALLRIRVGSGSRLAAATPMNRVYLSEFAAAQWIELELGDDVFPLNSGRRLTMYFVEYHAERNRHLATKNVVERPDWTEWFALDSKQNEPVRQADDLPGHLAGPIDVVYTWVDSECPDWQARYRRHRGDGADLRSSDNAERFVNRDELRHSLRSVWMFAPFVRNIYIVTDDQHPEWLLPGDDRVRVVSHREIFPDPSVLPTFNSHAIEANLHRIPGLSENFLYFNDDVFLGRDVTVCD
ncbi:MAG: stealth family protein, partial [Stackebrandtia sp.]